MRIVTLCAVTLFACSSPTRPTSTPAVPNGSSTTNPADGERTPLYPKGEPRFEGATFKNACGGDGDCKVGGCGGEVCTAEEGVITTCMAYPDAPRDATCGCVRGECVWWKGAGGTAPAPTGDAAGQGQPCRDGKCAPGLSCVKYYGIAGPRGQAFDSCEIPCATGKACPDGQQCITIADGPGQVCRPR